MLSELKKQWLSEDKVNPNQDADLIPMLNEALALEHGAIIQYYHDKAVWTGLHQQPFADVVTHNVEEEIKHVEMLTMKIVALGGTPTVAVKGIKEGVTAKELVANNLAAEASALAQYYKIHEQAKDLSLRLLIETIIQDEQEHYDNLLRLQQTISGEPK